METFIPVLTLAIGLALGVSLTFWLMHGRIVEWKELCRHQEDKAAILREENNRLHKLEMNLETQTKAAEEKLILLKEAKENWLDSFKIFSSEALRNNNQSFLELAQSTLEKFQEGARGDLKRRQEAIEQIVQPMRQSLEKVDTTIQQLEKAREGAYAGLREQVKNLFHTQINLQKETTNLVQALRAPHVRGQWGEMQLKRAVEFAGMVEYCDFVQQESTVTEEGLRRPDMIVRLPNGRRIIVDAKAPLSAYLEALKATDEITRKARLSDHARQIRDHISKLSAKAYWKQFDFTPEFAVLFLPGEVFFSAALEEDADLIRFGVNGQVILATPTTFIALLKAVAYGWQQEKVAEHAKTIHDLGRDLYERCGTLAGHFNKLGGHLDKAVDSYNKAVRSTESRLMVTARKLKELGSGNDQEIELLKPISKTDPLPPALENAGNLKTDEQ